MRLLAVLAFAVMLTGLGVGPGHAEKRVALVIGNGAYKNAPRLPNPRNDAEDVAAALKRTGFETIVVTDLDKAGMEDAEIRFARAARGADVALFYYSGHAMQFGGINYLAPVDAKLTDEADLRRMARMDDILSDLQQAKDIRIIVLDACRDNPLADSLRISIGLTRAVTLQRGLAHIDAPQGMIVAYATQAGRTVADGTGRNSPYTTAFLKHIEAKDEIGTIFRRISTDVYNATSHEQLPELSLSLVGEYYLRGRPGPTPEQQMEMTFWISVKDSTSPVVLATYLDRYPKGEFAPVARSLVERYKQQSKLEQAAREEAQKRQEEAKKAAEVKRLEEERRTREAALVLERQRGEQAKDDTQAKRLEQELAARNEELKKALEEARIAREAAKAAAEQKQAAVNAAEKATSAAEEAIATKREAEQKNQRGAEKKHRNAAKIAAVPRIISNPSEQAYVRCPARKFAKGRC
jgi:chemotaxis protein histidine kinase CheA